VVATCQKTGHRNTAPNLWLETGQSGIATANCSLLIGEGVRVHSSVIASTIICIRGIIVAVEVREVVQDSGVVAGAIGSKPGSETGC
jgi:hypothetical protein